MDEQFLDTVIRNIEECFGNLITETIVIPLNELLLPAKKLRAKALPRPQNWFVLYRRNLHAKVKSESGNIEFGNFLKFAARQWQSETTGVRKLFMTLSEIASVLHQFKHRYKPRRNQQLPFKLPLPDPSNNHYDRNCYDIKCVNSLLFK